MSDLPPRLSLAQVLDLAGYGVGTLNRRIAQGRMPAPIDRGRTRIFLRDPVLKALGMTHDVQTDADPWTFDADAYRKAGSRPIRGTKAARGRHVSSPVSGAGTPAAGWVATSNPPAASS